jgi:hypothetical protein
MASCGRADEEFLELQDWDANKPSEVIIQATPPAFLEGHWELAGLWLVALFFGMWFGMTGEDLSEIIGFCALSVSIGFCIFGLGQFGTEELVRTNSKHIFYLSVFFAFSVLVFHFLRRKLESPNLL